MIENLDKLDCSGIEIKNFFLVKYAIKRMKNSQLGVNIYKRYM